MFDSLSFRHPCPSHIFPSVVNFAIHLDTAYPRFTVSQLRSQTSGRLCGESWLYACDGRWTRCIWNSSNLWGNGQTLTSERVISSDPGDVGESRRKTSSDDALNATTEWSIYTSLVIIDLLYTGSLTVEPRFNEQKFRPRPIH